MFHGVSRPFAKPVLPFLFLDILYFELFGQSSLDNFLIVFLHQVIFLLIEFTCESKLLDLIFHAFRLSSPLVDLFLKFVILVDESIHFLFERIYFLGLVFLPLFELMELMFYS